MSFVYLLSCFVTILMDYKTIVRTLDVLALVLPLQGC